MKLIIDIEEELYEAYKGKPPMLGDAGMDMIAQAIANGTPYNPTGGDCISRRVVKGLISDKSIPIKFEKEKRGDWHRSLGMTLGDINKVIDNAPAVEPDVETNTQVLIKDAYDQGYTDGWKERFGEPDGRPQGEWIPVLERLPEKAGEYLCSLHYAIPPYHMLHPEKDIYVDDVRVNSFDGTAFVPSVIAWQPLPEPYKKGGAEE